MPDLPFQIISLIADLAIFCFVFYYFSKLWSKEKELEQKEKKVDTDYHQIVDTALTRERKIIDDATSEADRIIAGAKHINQGVRDEVNQALQMMVADIQKQAMGAAQNFTSNYQSSLKQLSDKSLAEFQNIAGNLKLDLEKQIKQFHESLLPALEKELADYKKSRLNQIDKTVSQIVEKASQEIINKSFSPDDHVDLVKQSLEKAKKEGVFD
jgi:cell division septum initiation protein DivIVA